MQLFSPTTIQLIITAMYNNFHLFVILYVWKQQSLYFKHTIIIIKATWYIIPSHILLFDLFIVLFVLDLFIVLSQIVLSSIVLV